MAKHKITKHELKEDKFVTAVLRAWHYCRDHLNFVIGGLVIVVVILAGVYGVVSFKEKRLETAEKVLAQGEQAHRFERYAVADSSYRFVIENFASTEFAQKATFLLGSTLFLNGRYDEAIETFEKYMDNPIEGEQDMIIACKVKIAASKEEKKEFAEAAIGYLEVVDNNPDYFDREYIMLSAGRCYQFSNQAKEAVELYHRFLNEYEVSPLRDKAQVALSKIETSVM